MMYWYFISGMVLGFALCVILNRAFYKAVKQAINITVEALSGEIDSKTIDKIIETIKK